MSNEPINSVDSNPVTLTGNSLTIEEVVAVARRHAGVTELSPGGRMAESRRWVEEVIAGRQIDQYGKPLAVYGVNTPFGSLAYKNVFSDPARAELLSRNLITSHSTGVGHYFAEDVVRAATLIRANTLVKGFSGIRPEVVNSLVQLLNAGIYPAVPEKGSVGASGDLAPLSHLVLAISKPPGGLDPVEDSGEVLVPFDPATYTAEDCVIAESTPACRTLRVKTYAKPIVEQAGIERWVLQAKEGLALNNGATFSAALAALAVCDAERLIKSAEVALAMTLEALKGYRDAFFPHVHRARGHPGQLRCADNVLRLVEDSNLVEGDLNVDPSHSPPQDAYSVRCAPQIIGSVRDVVGWVRGLVETELNAATDNPLIFASQDAGDAYYLPRPYKAVSCGNFHGEPLALALDFLGIAMAELGNVAERRVFRTLTGDLNRHLESMLVKSPKGEVGLRNGMMMAQYTAAALVSDNKTLAHPDSVDSIPTCEDQEDHVSMAPNAGRHTREIIWNVEQIVGIEMLCAAQALDFRLAGIEYDSKRGWRRVAAGQELRLGRGTRAAYDCVRKRVTHLDQDRALYPDMSAVAAMISSGELLEAVENALGSPLK
jgi:histidine ammonia-lyase